MLYTIDQILVMTRIAMNRNPPMRPLIVDADPDELRLDSLIRCNIERCAAEVYSEAPVSLMHETARDIDDDTIFWHPCTDSLYSGHIRLPDDFMRLVVYEMSDWQRPVNEALTADSPYFEAASSRYSGARGTPHWPTCLISDRAIGRVLEFHSCATDSAQIVQAKYVPVPRLDRHGAINIDRPLITMLCSRLSTTCG